MGYVENWFCVPCEIVLSPGAILALYVYKFCFSRPFKFKNYNTNKPEICFHQIGGDC